MTKQFTPAPWLVMGNMRNGHIDYVLPTSNNKEAAAMVDSFNRCAAVARAAIAKARGES